MNSVSASVITIPPLTTIKAHKSHQQMQCNYLRNRKKSSAKSEENELNLTKINKANSILLLYKANFTGLITLPEFKWKTNQYHSQEL